MFKKLLAFFAAMTVAVAFAAVDVNKATSAELDGIKGIGPVISTKIIDERKKGNFKSWDDFVERVKGIGEVNAAKFSAEGLTVGGAGYKGAAAAPAKKGDKPAAAAKVDAKPATTPATTAAPAKTDAKADAKSAVTATAPAIAKDEKKDPKADAKMKKDEKEKAKADEKKAKADAAKLKKDEAAKAKTDAKPAAIDDKKDDVKPVVKADATKPAASAAKK